MLNRFILSDNNKNVHIAAPCAAYPDDRHTRDVVKDLKEAMDLLYDFTNKLVKLHPNVFDIVEALLQRPRY